MSDELAAFEKRFETMCNNIIERLGDIGDRMDNLTSRIEVLSEEPIHVHPQLQFRTHEPHGLTWSSG